MIWNSCRFSIFSALAVALDVSLHTWLHTRWWCSLVSDPIIYARWSAHLGTGKRCDLCGQEPLCVFLLRRNPLRDQSQLLPWCWLAKPQEQLTGRTVDLVLGLVTRKTFDHEGLSKLDGVFWVFFLKASSSHDARNVIMIHFVRVSVLQSLDQRAC